ncbi:MAG: cytochrome c3 family protein [Bacteroidales bacterium]|nr:cytochrome c3 family protein [Bacteroidales bacterium]
MRKKISSIIFLNMLIGIIFSNVAFSQDEGLEFEYAQENHQCLKCHGQSYYFFENTWTERMVKERMNPYSIVDSALFYDSNHKNFRCVDCHSEDYLTFPHDGELRMEEITNCIDCHAGDDDYAKFQFEKIEIEHQNSVHSNNHSDDFTCWMCHNPHTYKINARSNEKLKQTIQYDNEICLSCHADQSKYQLLTTKVNPSVLDKHDWLPNQLAHFKSVRCIECHSVQQDELLVSHSIKPKEEAVKLCVDCHSKNSILAASLYKLQIHGYIDDNGNYNPVLLEEGYVIGANRNYFLNIGSLVIFGLVMGALLLHTLLRMFIKR